MALPTKPTIRTMIRDRVSMYMGATNTSSGAMAKDPHQIEATICTVPIAIANGLRHRTAYTSTTRAKQQVDGDRHVASASDKPGDITKNCGLFI